LSAARAVTTTGEPQRPDDTGGKIDPNWALPWESICIHILWDNYNRKQHYDMAYSEFGNLALLPLSSLKKLSQKSLKTNS